MIVIPEIKKIIICTPKAGSTSIIQCVLDKYPESTLIHRHMEADNVPKPFKNWDKIGIFREPIDRLWSLYNFLFDFRTPSTIGWEHHIKALKNSVRDKSFNEWIVTNDYPFTQPVDIKGNTSILYSVKHLLPENKKSQFLYLRPDLGTKIIHYDEIFKLEKILGITMPKLNQTNYLKNKESLSEDTIKHLEKYLIWDMNYQKEYIKIKKNK